MSEILKSKGIICFFVFVIIMGVLSSNTLNSMKNYSDIDNIIIMEK